MTARSLCWMKKPQRAEPVVKRDFLGRRMFRVPRLVLQLVIRRQNEERAREPAHGFFGIAELRPPLRSRAIPVHSQRKIVRKILALSCLPD